MVPCEDEVIRRAAQGDQQAFRLLWEVHHAVVMAAALRLCHHRALAEDITQGAFLLAWGTVKSRLNRTRERLRLLLADERE